MKYDTFDIFKISLSVQSSYPPTESWWCLVPSFLYESKIRHFDVKNNIYLLSEHPKHDFWDNLGYYQYIKLSKNFERFSFFSIKIAKKNKAQLKQFSCTFLLKTNNFIFFLHIDLKMAQKSILIPKCAFLPQN